MIKIFTLLCFALTLCCTQGCFNEETTKQKVVDNYAHGNYALVYKDLRRLANNGDTPSQYGLGYLYYYGIGIHQDRDTARYWIRRAMLSGYTPAIEAYRQIADETDLYYPANT